jgi:O-antigen/teichoic acid export membrane protein
MIRADFWFSLVFILTAPEFIQILGQQWQPMQTTFQLMILYALLDPLAVSASNLLLATGHPELNVRARVVQLAAFLPAVILLGRWRGIEGVALAADLMIGVGVLFLFYHTRRLVDYSLRRLLFWPAVALITTAVVVLLLNPLWAAWNPWLALPGKAFLITCLYGSMLWLTEREQLRSGWQMVWEVIGPRIKVT